MSGASWNAGANGATSATLPEEGIRYVTHRDRAQFAAMRAAWLAEVARGSPSEVSRHLRRFVDTGLVAVFDGRHYLSELGMRRTANMSRVLPDIIRRRHGAYLDRWYREHELRHNDGVNRLVVRFAREGVAVIAGWWGEVNVPGLTQVRSDLLLQVSGGTLGAGAHYIEFERSAVSPDKVADKVGPYRRMAAARRPLPLLVACETGRGELPRGGPGIAHADDHPGKGPGWAGNGSGDCVEPERSADNPALPGLTGRILLTDSLRGVPGMWAQPPPLRERRRRHFSHPRLT